MIVYSQFPPRVRVEWLIAGTRVALAVGVLIALSIATPAALSALQVYLVAGYLAYSLAVLALVWSPVSFGRGWEFALHAFDTMAFLVLAFFAGGAPSPFYASFTFLVSCATLRWQLRGVLSTVVLVLLAYGGISIYASSVLVIPEFGLEDFVIRVIYLLVIAGLLAYFGDIQQRYHLEVTRLAAWPRRISGDWDETVGEVIEQSMALLEAPRIVVAWEERDEGQINFAWNTEDGTTSASESSAPYGRLVLSTLETASFQTPDASTDTVRLVARTGGMFRYTQVRPLTDALRDRFEIRAVQSWPLEGELIQGRIFALDKTRMRIDDLITGEIVARLAATRLDSLYLLERIRQATAFEERVRVARDLHDNVLQAQTGAALQLLVARRALERDPLGSRERFDQVQRILEDTALEMRAFIGRLRPEPDGEGRMPSNYLGDRLEALRRRIARQWDVKLVLRLHGIEQIPSTMAEDVYRLAQEGALNAARHAEASVVKMDLTVGGQELRLGIADDGRGFPFHGTYDLATLNAMDKGPLTLKERVAVLGGTLTLRSQDSGAQLLITLPLARGSH